MTLRKLGPEEVETENRRAEREKSSKHHNSKPTYTMAKGRDPKALRMQNGLSETELTAYKLRLQGYSYSAIADTLGYAGAAGAFHAYKRARKKIDDVIIDVKEQRDLAISRMDRLLQAVWDRADNGYLPAIDRALKIEERRSKILGIDAPERTVNVNQNVGGLNIEKVFADESAIDLVHATLEHLSLIAGGDGVVSDGGTVSDGETSDLLDENPDYGGDGPEAKDHRDDAAEAWEE